MPKRQGGQLLAKTLYDLGVRNVFTLAGGHINPVYKACTDLGIRLIDTHHEQGAAMAADAYGRVTRAPGVCLVTAGPGMTNTLTGIAGSYLSNSPVIIIAGKSGIEENDILSLQEIDQLSMVRPVTKWARTVYDIKRIPEYVTNAYKNCVIGRPGPTYIDMSYEVLYPSCDTRDLSNYSLNIPDTLFEAPDSDIESFFECLKKARKPVIIAGSGSWYSRAGANLNRFAELLNVPVFTLNMGRGIVPDSNCFGVASPGSPRGFREITAKCDLVILLGTRLSIYMGFGKTFNPKAEVVQVDIEPSEINRNVSATLPVVSDIDRFLMKCISHAEDNDIEFNFTKWTKEAGNISRKTFGEFRKNILGSRKKTVHPAKVANTVGDFIGDDGIVVVDGGDCQSWTDTTCRINKPGHYIKGGPLGCMGVGIPFALGTKVARPDNPVCLITGDGAAAMNFMEIETAVKHHVPFVVVVCNDAAWGMTKHQIEITYPKAKDVQGVELGFVPFHEIARSVGAYGEAVYSIKDLKPALERAFGSGLPAVINVKTDPDAVSGATYTITNMMMKGT